MPTVSQDILKQLHKQGDHVSGEELSRRLGISRTAIWKQINSLRRMGYVIEASPRVGYRLIKTPEQITTQEMNATLNTSVIGQDVLSLPQVPSTNHCIKDYIKQGAKEGFTLIAQEQTQGRGRRGREWHSQGKGLYLSIYLKPAIAPQQASKLTLLAALAVTEVLHQQYQIPAQIKWPNDVLVADKKICGILTELSADMESVHYLIVGIGINVNQDPDDWPDELRNIASSLKSVSGKEVDSKLLLKRLLSRMDQLYLLHQGDQFRCLITASKHYSCIVGKNITISTASATHRGKAIDIADDGSLLVEYEDGRTEGLWAGDVSIRT